MKDYINNIYQAFSKVRPKSQQAVNAGYIIRHGEIQENWYEKDEETGIIYQEKPNWLGGETKTLDQGMADYIFQDVNVPIGEPKHEEKKMYNKGLFVGKLPIKKYHN